MPPCDTGEPCIEFTSVPAYGSFDNLQGVVRNAVTPTDAKLCPYIRVEGGWWTKPTVASPCVSVRPDGTWEADITTGGSDEKALEIAAFLLPIAAPDPPLLSGFCVLPDELNAFPKASADRTAGRRTIFFSGYAWSVKDLFWGPGPNHFSDSPDNVWVDESGHLHLRITQRDGTWFSAEVVSRDTFGYGTYIFSLASRVDQLDENVVLGLFTWDNDACESHNNELDIEFSRFGIRDDPTAQYVVQPFDTCGRFRFDMPEAEYSTHALAWHPERIRFLSLQGPNLIQSYEFIDVACIPTPVHGNARINLWLNSGIPPSDGQEVEVVITHFLFLPAAN